MWQAVRFKHMCEKVLDRIPSEEKRVHLIWEGFDVLQIYWLRRRKVKILNCWPYWAVTELDRRCFVLLLEPKFITYTFYVLQGTAWLERLDWVVPRGGDSDECLSVHVHKSSDVRWSQMLCKRDNRGIVHLLATACSPCELWQVFFQSSLWKSSHLASHIETRVNLCHLNSLSALRKRNWKNVEVMMNYITVCKRGGQTEPSRL